MVDAVHDSPSGFGKSFWIALVVFIVVLAAVAIAVALGSGGGADFVYEGFN